MLSYIHKLSWAVATIFILAASIYFSIKLKFLQCNFKQMFKNLFKKNKHSDAITPFQSLMIVLAGRIGVGSIAGVALAISLGGIGSIFWMWIIGFLSAILSFVETVLGVTFKEKDEGNIYRGGPSYYIEKGLHKKKMAILYSILVFFTNVVGFLAIQANTITKAVQEIYYVSPILIALVIGIITSFIIFGGIKRIANASSKLVPFMSLFYIGVSFYILINNISEIPFLFSSIIKDAFSLRPFLTGFIPCIIVGVQRGIFSSEAGLGTGAIAASTIESKDAIGQGFVQMLGIYITTMLVCTATALVICSTPYQNIFFNDLNGIEITKFAFEYHLGYFGTIVVFTSIILFSFSTILAGYYDGESSLKFIKKNVTKFDLFILKMGTIILLFLGSIIPSVALWNYVDIMVAYLAILNIYAMILLRKKIFLCIKS